jgi:hypothetical protein
MDQYISSSLVFDKSQKRFSILNIYDDDDEEDIIYYKIPAEALQMNNLIKEEAFNPYQNKCCIIS